MTETMRAFQLVAWDRPAEFREVPIPQPGPGEVLVKIGGVGLCHTDEMFFHAPPGAFPYPLPFTLGHENAGWVAELGAGTEDSGLHVGDAVIVYASSPCGRCPFCVAGAENNCPQAWIGRGFGHDGGLAEFMLVSNVDWLVPLGDLDPRTVGPLCDAGTTSFHAVQRCRSALDDDRATAVVIGAGGLGGYAIQWIKLLSSAKVIAVDLERHRLDYAEELGADETLIADATTVDRILELTDGLGAEAVLDFVGVDDSLATAVRVGKRLGTIGIVGAGGGTLTMQWGSIPFECSLWYMQASTINDLGEVVKLAQSGKVRVDVEPFDFEHTADAYAAMSAATTKSRAVVQIGDAP
ncbi:MAG TPA: alcohol dehydrogenase catalytic domain-containing protein [Ilumatobacteraceae bacterium]|nr:alcohol dehydrogenase catalytic domain-containing protein [Ilumatobacteraceae bacterium]